MAIATFKIETSFNMTKPDGIEVIASGLLLDGTLFIGSESTIVVQGAQAKVTIKSVGWGKPDQNRNTRWGMQLAFENPEFRQIVIQNRIQEQVIKLYSPSPNE